MIDTIKKYFPALSDKQYQQLEMLMTLYPEWNEKINVISRKDIENLEVNHILHSMSIAKFINFTDGSSIMDLGTGGGLPGIPLAILFPNANFVLIDRTGKKVKVAQEIANAIGLKNVTFIHGDAAECKDKFDFVVSRAVMPQADLTKIVRKSIAKECKNAVPNGLITLKGGDLDAEIRKTGKQTLVTDLSTWFDEPFFETKKIIYTPIY